MPADEYTPVVRGALKLKGTATPSGITKKKKKKAAKHDDPSASSAAQNSALQKALQEEDAAAATAEIAGAGGTSGGKAAGEGLSEEELRELESRDSDGKTAAERAYQEMRRRRVCVTVLFLRLSLSTPPFSIFSLRRWLSKGRYRLPFSPSNSRNQTSGTSSDKAYITNHGFSQHSYKTASRKKASRRTSSVWRNLTNTSRT